MAKTAKKIATKKDDVSTKKATKTKSGKVSAKASKIPVVLTCPGRILYPALSEAVEYQGKKNFGLTFAMTKEMWKSRAECKELRQSVLSEGRRYLRDDSLKLDGFANPFRDGSDKKQSYYKDTIFIRVKTQYEPTVLGPDGVEWDKERIKKIKSGDYGRLVVAPYGWTYMGKDGISLNLSIVQFGREGAAVGGGREAAMKLVESMELDLDDMPEMETPKELKKGKASKAEEEDEDEEEELDEDEGDDESDEEEDEDEDEDEEEESDDDDIRV